MASPALDELQVTLDCAPGSIRITTNMRVNLLLAVATSWSIKPGTGSASSLTFLSPCCKAQAVPRRCNDCGELLDGVYATQLLSHEGKLNYAPIAQMVATTSIDPVAQAIGNARLESWLETIIAEDALLWPRNIRSTIPLLEL